MTSQWAIAEWDYVATHEDELSFHTGDHILIQDTSHEEWWEGECNGLSGVFPANRCRLLPVMVDDNRPSLEQSVHFQDPHQNFDDNDVLDIQNQRHIHSEADDFNHQGHDKYNEMHPSTVLDPQTNYISTSRAHSPPPEPSDDASDEEHVVLPPNWSATTNAQGRLYYYNMITKETSWKLPLATTIITTAAGLGKNSEEDVDDYQYDDNMSDEDNNVEVFAQDQKQDSDDEPLPEGWSSAYDESGTLYFFDANTGRATWDRPQKASIQKQQAKSGVSSESSTGPSTNTDQTTGTPSPLKAVLKHQSSMEENMLQNQLLNLSLSEEELRVLQLNHLPPENIQRKGSLRVKSQKVTTNATISSWKDYWVVVYMGFLLLYRDESGTIKHAYSMKPSVESMNKLRHATQVKPSGCFDADKVAVELPMSGQAFTKKKNFFCITPGASVRLLLQDVSGGDVKAWVKDIKASLTKRKTDEQTATEEPYLMQILKRQTAAGGEGMLGLKMNKKIEENDLRSNSRNPLIADKARGIRNMMTQGIHVPRRKSAQDERLKLPVEEENHHESSNTGPHPRYPLAISTTGTANMTGSTSSNRSLSNLIGSSHDQSKDSSPVISTPNKKDHEAIHVDSHPHHSETGYEVGSPASYSSSHHGTKGKFSNMSRNFFSKDKEKESKEKEREDKKEKERHKEKSKEKSRDKSRDKESRKEQANTKPVQDITPVFGGMLTVEPGMTVPRVVELCIKTIEARGLATAGIYRVSGHMSSIQNLKRAFNEGSPDVEKLIEKEPDVNTIAALLKLYFRELKEPLMLFDFYPSFIAAADISEYNEKLYTIKSLVHSLPTPNFNTLQYLMMHLGRVQDQYQTTKMDSANLAICFAPNLLRQEVNDITSIIHTGKQSSIIDTLIEQRDWVFDPYPEEEGEHQEEQENVTKTEDAEAGGHPLEPKVEQDQQDQSHPHYHSQSEHEQLSGKEQKGVSRTLDIAAAAGLAPLHEDSGLHHPSEQQNRHEDQEGKGSLASS